MSRTERPASPDVRFTPALGRAGLTGAYDFAIKLLTRERLWRTALLEQLAPRNGETILDVGCGTGSFALLMKCRAPGARIIGLDPDPDVLHRAEAKARKAGVEIEWRQGFASDAATLGVRFDKTVSSLVFHQVSIVGKRSGIAAMAEALKPGGELHIADYAAQTSPLMRSLFRLTVQRLDGLADTQPNADGAIEAILADLARAPVVPRRVISTPTGAISLFHFKAPKSI
ncbi:class I SAM-dependent methyltransferase [Sphingopyxis alaskensis]|uniref:Methyltransferase type 11 n=1 Tax=Sphingopyxis alaskensis (strain DSM 13593 / LMG 18877 / RB2256) TaxID=317655 RepID=Q1GQ07_SPHAL|nr:class I SAM-dependent methyltransferase [Sphingopyxis alaskensis]ABF54265.1 Methyltransferase type 11 [Sphingopyxis alaskensis RB2256]